MSTIVFQYMLITAAWHTVILDDWMVLLALSATITRPLYGDPIYDIWGGSKFRIGCERIYINLLLLLLLLLLLHP